MHPKTDGGATTLRPPDLPWFSIRVSFPYPNALVNFLGAGVSLVTLVSISYSGLAALPWLAT